MLYFFIFYWEYFLKISVTPKIKQHGQICPSQFLPQNKIQCFITIYLDKWIMPLI